MKSSAFVFIPATVGNVACGKLHEEEESLFEQTDSTTETTETCSCVSEDSRDSELSDNFLECRELHGCILSLTSRQVTQKAVKKIMAGIMTICEESAMLGEDGTSIDLDDLINCIWPETMFEGFEKHLFCIHHYNQVTTVQERLLDTLGLVEWETLVIILSLKQGICGVLQGMGFEKSRKLQPQGCLGKSPSYEWQIRRFCSSGADFTSWLHLKWPVAQVEEPPIAVDEFVEKEDHLMGPPRGIRESGRGSRTYACGKDCSASVLLSGNDGETIHFFRA